MIDYHLLAKAKEYYESRGFDYIEVDWLIPSGISDITKPAESQSVIVTPDKLSLLASGEQGFLYHINKGNLPKSGAYQTITPCFRNDFVDSTHLRQFMKLELISYCTDKVAKREADNKIQEMINSAIGFFTQYCSTGLKVIDLGDSFDIEYKGIEIGSYGYRECEFCSWIYGTGIAEPRFSRLLKGLH